MKNLRIKLNMFFIGLFVLTMLFSLSGQYVFAADTPGVYLPVDIQFTGDDIEETSFTVVIEALDGAPLPNPSEKTVEITKDKRSEQVTFDFLLPSVGVYQYRLHQLIGDDSEVEYDDRVYNVTLLYENSPDGKGFRSTFVVSIEDSDVKPKVVLFNNTEVHESTPPVEETTTRKKGDTPDTGGETNQWNYLAWMVASSFAVFSFIIIYVIYRNEDKQQAEHS